jgi:hypothetical protein
LQQIGSGNFANGGFITQTVNDDGLLGKWTIYSTNGKTYLINQKDKITKLLSHSGWRSINLFDGYKFIYLDNIGKLWVYNPKRDRYCSIFDQYADVVFALGRCVYYSSRDKNDLTAQSICMIDLAWGSQMTVCGDPPAFLSLHEEWFYFSNKIHNSRICKIGIDGKNKVFLNDDASSFINVVDGFSYYINNSDNDKVYRINLDGSDRELVLSDSADWLNCYRGSIFYTNKCDSDRLYSYCVESGNRSKLTDSPVSNIHLIGDWCFYINRVSNKLERIIIGTGK